MSKSIIELYSDGCLFLEGEASSFYQPHWDSGYLPEFMGGTVKEVYYGVVDDDIVKQYNHKEITFEELLKILKG